MSEQTDPLDDARQLVRALDPHHSPVVTGATGPLQQLAALPDDLWYWVRKAVSERQSPLRTFQDLMDAARQSDPTRSQDDLLIAARREWRSMRDEHKERTWRQAVDMRSNVLEARDAINAEGQWSEFRVVGVGVERFIENLQARGTDHNGRTTTATGDVAGMRCEFIAYPHPFIAGQGIRWGAPFALYGSRALLEPREPFFVPRWAPRWETQFLAEYWHPIWQKYNTDRHNVVWCVFYVRQCQDDPPAVCVRTWMRAEVADVVLPWLTSSTPGATLGRPHPAYWPLGAVEGRDRSGHVGEDFTKVVELQSSLPYEMALALVHSVLTTKCGSGGTWHGFKDEAVPGGMAFRLWCEGISDGQPHRQDTGCIHVYTDSRILCQPYGVRDTEDTNVLPSPGVGDILPNNDFPQIAEAVIEALRIKQGETAGRNWKAEQEVHSFWDGETREIDTPFDSLAEQLQIQPSSKVIRETLYSSPSALSCKLRAGHDEAELSLSRMGERTHVALAVPANQTMSVEGKEAITEFVAAVILRARAKHHAQQAADEGANNSPVPEPDHTDKQIIEAVKKLRANRQRATDEEVAALLPESRPGQMYARETVNRRRTKLRERGFDV